MTNPYSGGSEVSFNFFKNIPSRNKILFQFSDNKKKHKNVKSIYIKNSKFSKIFSIKKIANEIKYFCKNKKKLIIIIEGASWAGYSFLLYFLLKKDLSKAKFIYHSQNIEYLLRKNKSNFLITQLTKYFEKYIANNFDIFTCTSERERKIVNKIYGIKSQILTNGLEIKNNIQNLVQIKKRFNYIFFGGNIDFIPNYNALEILVKKIMPEVNRSNPSIKLIVSGNKKLPFNEKFLINIGFVSKRLFLRYLKGASLFVNPISITFGVQTKTLHALAFGKTIISTKEGIAGIQIKHKFKNVFISNSNSDFIKKILSKSNSKKINTKASQYYLKKYNMRRIVKKFFIKNNLLH